MASSDDEGEMLPDSVSEYYFSDENDEPLPFSKLPVQWKESESSSANPGRIFLRGNVDNGLGKFYQQVKAWKYDILTATPEISVLSKDNHWIKLKKPRKSYEKLIRSILISVNCLCFLRSKPEASGKSLWDYVSKVFSLYDTRPSENDLIDHISFIKEAVKRDETLAKSKFLAAFLENPRKKSSPDGDVGAATRPSFIVDDINGETQDDDINQTEDSESDGEDDHFDSVCAICDNGGKITCCEGKCFRSFHTTPDSEEAQDSNCESLCLSPKDLEGEKQLICENCQYNLHQCYVCGELGSSNKSSNPEVFRCSSATCGHFYHPKCVAKLLQKNDKTEQQTLKENIAAGEPFICPAHKCDVCKGTENEKVKDMQFAICRRCPKSYHRKCLPRDILFEDQIGEDDDADTRAWDGLLNKSRALIYCLEHEIDPDLLTPVRTIIFRNILDRKATSSKKKLAVKEISDDAVPLSKRRSFLQSQRRVERSAVKPEGSSKKRPTVSSAPEASKKRKVADASKNGPRKSLSTVVKKPSTNDGQPSLGSRLFDYFTGADNNLEKDEISVDEKIQTVEVKSPRAEILPPLDDESKQRILAMMKEAGSSVKLEDVKKYHQAKVPSTHAHSSRVDKSIILARVEGSVEAVHLALKKLDEGCSVQDAMAVCDPGDIDQLLRWKDKLKVYLAPFLHGNRYTSFGRHFTKVEKLEKIVDKLHWYIEDGDTVVDFCCGANDFSCLMKKKLDETGKKKCSYKNFDIRPPKNDFNFEKRDWMTVSPKELPAGSQLVMGLNPPFGVNAALANKFIDKALQFKPKLIVLIVPPETERLDNKRKDSYDLVWEDVELLANKSFYLPGSVNVNDKIIEQWNTVAPPLYLWSRSNWTNKYKYIAQQQGHIPQAHPPPQSDENGPESSRTAGKTKVEDRLSVQNDDSKRTPTKANTSNSKKRKKGKQSGSETESKQNLSKGKGNRNSKKKTPVKKASKTEKHDDSAPNLEKSQAPVKAQKLDIAQAPVEAQKLETERAPVEAQKHEKAVEAKKRKIERAPVEAQKREERAEAQKREVARVADDAEKHEISRAPVSVQKHEKSLDPVSAKKHESTRVPSREIEAPKHEKFQAPSHETDHEKRRTTPRENEAQKHEKARASPHQIETLKHERKRSRDFEAQKYESKRPSPHQIETQKYERKRTPSRDFEAQRYDSKRPSLHEDFSFVDVDQQLDGRYNSAIDESTFSLENDMGSFDQYIEKKYGSSSDDLYTGSTVPVHRRPDSANHAPPGYSMRSDHLQYPPGYDRVVGRGSYYDETGPRAGGSYSVARHEPGLTRYSSSESTPYNRSSTSATQRYAPRLDELNHTRVNMGRSELDEIAQLRMSGLGRPEPVLPLGSLGVAGYRPGPPTNGAGYRMDSLGFAPGPYNPYQHNSSGGWVNE